MLQQVEGHIPKFKKKINKSTEGKEVLCLTGGLGLPIQPFAHSRMATWHAHPHSQNLPHEEWDMYQIWSIWSP